MPIARRKWTLHRNRRYMHCGYNRKAEKAVQIVEQWSKAHPIKTRQSEFLKMFPNTKLDTDGVIAIRPCDIDSKCCTDDDYLRKCGACAGDYWLTEVTDNGND